MINVFFIADLHFGHKNIIGYSRPQFDSLDDMHDTIIKNWNSVVKPKDVVYVLGDVAFGKDNLKYMQYLNGRKHLVMGNHDVYAIEEYTPYFDHIWGCNNYKGCILTHIPIIESQFYRWKLNIHGHVHVKNEEEIKIEGQVVQDGDITLSNNPKYFNVCAEHINMTPIRWEEIKEITKLDFIPRRIVL